MRWKNENEKKKKKRKCIIGRRRNLLKFGLIDMVVRQIKEDGHWRRKVMKGVNDGDEHDEDDMQKIE